MDPLAILNYLRSLGTLQAMACGPASVPALDALDPETCHLAFDFWLETAAARDAIEGAFSFVRDDCELSIGEPDAQRQRAGRADRRPARLAAAGRDPGRRGRGPPAQLERGRAAGRRTACAPAGEVLQHAEAWRRRWWKRRWASSSRREAAGGGETAASSACRPTGWTR